MQNLNWVDYIFLAIFLVTILGGLTKGLVKEIISLITWVVAIIVACLYANPLALKFTGASAVQSAVNQVSNASGVDTTQAASYAAIGVCFILIFVAVMIIGSIIGSILSLAFQAGILGIGNRLLGGVFGIAKGFVINLVLIFLVQMTPFNEQPAWQESQIVVAYQPAVEWLNNLMAPSMQSLKEKVSDTMQEVNTSVQQLTH